MHLRGGLCNDNRVLSAEAVDRMHDDRIEAVYAGDAGVGTGYGMGWWVDRASAGSLTKGAYGAVPWIDLDDSNGAYLVIEADAPAGIELAGQLYELVDEIVNAV